MAFDTSALLAVSQWLRFFVDLNRCSVIKLTPEGGDPFDGSMLMTDDAFRGEGNSGRAMEGIKTLPEHGVSVTVRESPCQTRPCQELAFRPEKSAIDLVERMAR